jgi:hypothetical protein
MTYKDELILLGRWARGLQMGDTLTLTHVYTRNSSESFDWECTLGKRTSYGDEMAESHGKGASALDAITEAYENLDLSPWRRAADDAFRRNQEGAGVNWSCGGAKRSTRQR